MEHLSGSISPYSNDLIYLVFTIRDHGSYRAAFSAKTPTCSINARAYVHSSIATYQRRPNIAVKTAICSFMWIYDLLCTLD